MGKYDSILTAIRRIQKQEKGFLPLHAPVFIGNEKKYLNECIDSTFVSSVGKFVNEFEDKIAKYTAVKKAVACVNGTAALHLALLLAGVNKEDEVVTQALSFVATANAISYCGAKAVFLDVDNESLGLCPIALRKWLNTNAIIKDNNSYNRKSGRKISACVPMHSFGHPCKIDEIITICEEYNIPVIEDAAESLGSFYKGKHTGSYGKIGVLSFNGNKTITCGGGGMLLFNDENLAKRAKHLSTQAKTNHPWEFIHDEIGFNYRMPNINAALGLAQIENIDYYLKSKRKTAKAYQKLFANTKIKFVQEPQFSKSNYWLNSILFEDKNQRDGFLAEANKSGVMCRPAWNLITTLPMFMNCESDTLKNAKNIADTLVNIPSNVVVNKKQS
ncbi:MAG TPA: LegC family aminotransferase [Bacteroidetes bacterium]|nr:LegC family aminotransferase [Bacteroidota bacterium]